MNCIIENIENSYVEDFKSLGIVKLRERIKGLDLFENLHLTDNYLLRFLYSTEFNLEEAFIRIKGYHEHVENCPQFYPITGPLDRRSLVEKRISIVLPHCDREGRPIMIFKPGNINCRDTSLAQIAGLDDNWFEYVLTRNPDITSKGLCYILDLKDHSYGFIRWFNIENLKMGIQKIANIPVKEFMIHCVNKSLAVKVVKTLACPLIPESSKKNIRFHFTNWASLHEYVDPKYLPEEYGGSKEVDYENIYQTFFKGHDEIVQSYKSSRNVKNYKNY